MRTKRFLTRLAAGTMVFAIAATGSLLVGGVANAAPSTNPPAVRAALDDHSTTTSLSMVPNSFPAGLPVTLIVIVRPSAAAGTVQFKDGDNNVGNPVTVLPGHVTRGSVDNADVGVAVTLTSSLAVGTHSLTAVFTPSDTSAYNPSTSPAESLTVTPPLLSGLSLPIESLLQSLLGGLGGHVGDIGSLPQFPPSVFGRAAGGTPAPLDPASLIQSVLDGLHL